jgi:hypothetical protein
VQVAVAAPREAAGRAVRQQRRLPLQLASVSAIIVSTRSWSSAREVRAAARRWSRR